MEVGPGRILPPWPLLSAQISRARSLPAVGGAGRARLAVVVHLDLGAADGVADGLGALLRGLPEAHLLRHPRLLGNDGLLPALGRLDRALAEGGLSAGHRPVHRAALDLHMFLAQGHLLFHRGLDNVAADADAATPGLPLADAEPLLDDRDAGLVVCRAEMLGMGLAGALGDGGARRGHRRGGAAPAFLPPGRLALVEVDGAAGLQRRGHLVETVVRHLGMHHAAAAAEALAQHRGVLVRQGEAGQARAVGAGVKDLAARAGDMPGEVVGGALGGLHVVEIGGDGPGHRQSPRSMSGSAEGLRQVAG